MCGSETVWYGKPERFDANVSDTEFHSLRKTHWAEEHAPCPHTAPQSERNLLIALPPDCEAICSETSCQGGKNVFVSAVILYPSFNHILVHTYWSKVALSVTYSCGLHIVHFGKYKWTYVSQQGVFMRPRWPHHPKDNLDDNVVCLSPFSICCPWFLSTSLLPWW